MTQFGTCKVCGCVVRTDHFTAHRTFHEETGTRDPGAHGFLDFVIQTQA